MAGPWDMFPNFQATGQQIGKSRSDAALQSTQIASQSFQQIIQALAQLAARKQQDENAKSFFDTITTQQPVNIGGLSTGQQGQGIPSFNANTPVGSPMNYGAMQPAQAQAPTTTTQQPNMQKILQGLMSGDPNMQQPAQRAYQGLQAQQELMKMQNPQQKVVEGQAGGFFQYDPNNPKGTIQQITSPQIKPTQTKETRLENGVPVIKKSPDGTSWSIEDTKDQNGKVVSSEFKPLVKPSNTTAEIPDFKPELSGRALLNAMPVGRQALVKAIGEGRQQIEKVTSLRGSQRQQMATEVARVYPTYDKRWVDASYTLAKDATTGNIAKNARSLNTAIGHLQQFDEAAKALQNVDITGYNSLQNWVRQNTGDPRVVAVKLTATALKSELATTFKGGASGAAGTEAEIKDWGTNFETNLAGGQYDQAVNTTLKLMGSRLGALNDQYSKTPYHPEGFSIISPKAQEILDSYGFKMEGAGGGAVSKELDPLGILK